MTYVSAGPRLARQHDMRVRFFDLSRSTEIIDTGLRRIIFNIGFFQCRVALPHTYGLLQKKTRTDNYTVTPVIMRGHYVEDP
jgi:hypothetical protein